MFNEILIQTAYYFVVMLLTFFIVGLIQKGFFIPFLRVKISFGKFVLVKIKAINRDYYRVGRIEEGFLLYKSDGGMKRLSIPDSSYFYPSVGVRWIDVEEEKNAVMKPDYSTISGFDAIKYNNLYTRALTSPGLNDNKEKIMIACFIAILIGFAILGFLIYKNGMVIEEMKALLSSTVKGIIGG